MNNSKIEILLIEDTLAEADLIKEMLSEARQPEFSIQHVQSLGAGLSLLQSRDFDIVLVDLGLPDSQGLETALSVRQQSKHTPVVVLTVLDDEDAALKSLQMDIQDYLVKEEINARQLTRSIRYAIQRKRDVEELRRSNMKFATIFQATPVMLVISKPIGGEIIDVNESLLTTCGYRREEVVGRTARELCIWENPEDRDKVVQELLQQRPVRDLEISFKDKSGQPVTGLMSAELIEIEGEQYMLGLVKDISEQKRTEAEIKRLNTVLESRAYELENYNEELAAFTYSVSHDLRKPLNNISVTCQAIEVLSSDELNDESKGLLKMAIEGVKQMVALIDTLLRFSRSTHIELHRKTVDLTKMARVITANLRLTEAGRQVTFRIAEGLTANGDSELLQVVLENLIGNAWKYTGKQMQAVIDFCSTEIDGTTTFFVKDNGPGFNMEDAEGLFVPFKRLPGTAEFTGHGIGLATVARIIRRHGGKVWAEGEPGKGATFYFTLQS